MNALQIKTAAQSLLKNGYALIPNFLSPATCKTAIDEVNRLIDNFEPTPEIMTVFDTESGNNPHCLSKYFLDSAGGVGFFFEKDVWENGKLKVQKRQAINKIAHALHEHNDVFKGITYTEGVEEICNEVGITRPLVVQSMAILKPPKIGGRVTIHQDSNFLHSDPDTLLGFWIPLQDATVKNGCLWGLPGSHKGKLYYRSNVQNGVPINEIYHEKDYKQEDFVPLEMEKGTLAIFTGKFLHKSQQNTSNMSRYAYTWHLMDETSKWLPKCWLQRKEFPKFPLRLRK